MSAIPESVAVDARAKITWGESQESVLAFLQSKNIGDKDAFALIDELMKERASMIRSDGRQKIWLGTALILAPIAYYFVTQLIGYWSMKFFSALIVTGFVGLYKSATGFSMLLQPRSHKGDLANTEI